MKNLKSFEKWNYFNRSPKMPIVGSYILSNYKGSGADKTDEFLNSNIGTVVDLDINSDQCINAKYENVPYNLYLNDGSFWWFRLSEIEFWSTSRDEVEKYMEAKKYNI